MSDLLRLTLLGSMQIQLGNRSIVHKVSRKGLALLIYLCVTGREHSRDHIADLFWSDRSTRRARKNLRDVLPLLRREVGDYLSISRDALGLDKSLPYWLDVKVFDQFGSGHMTDNLDLVEDVLNLYQGDFLAEFHVRQAPMFEDWVASQREQYHILALQRFQQFSLRCIQEGAYEQGITSTSRLLTLEPWDERGHRLRMRLLALAGQRQAALHQFEQCRQVLQEELDVVPSQRTMALYEQIRDGVHISVIGRAPSHGPFADRQEPTQGTSRNVLQEKDMQRMVTSTSSLVGVPGAIRLYGREKELAQLDQWVTGGQKRLVLVTGMGGNGKSALLASFARSLFPEHGKEVENLLHKENPLHAARTRVGPTGGQPRPLKVVWRSLKDVPSPLQLVHGWRRQLQWMSREGTYPLLTDDWETELGFLLDELHQNPYLLILDDLEALMRDGEWAGRFRPDCEGFADLFQRIAECEHQSCLLLAGREEPQNASLRALQHRSADILRLGGLQTEAAVEMLRSAGQAGTRSSLEKLSDRYSGNPLAMQMVVQVLRDFIGIDVESFLAAETPVLDDVREMMTQQFQRLPSLEQEILEQIASHSDPIPLNVLHDSLQSRPGFSTYLEAQRSLLRRAMVEHMSEGIVATPLVQAYVQMMA